jgi:polyhydroxybutyrate depolymerase
MIVLHSAAAAESLQITVNGKPRTMVLERGVAQGPSPTIIMLHGAAGPPTVDQHVPGLAQIASRAGFVTVRPEGIGGKWNIFPAGKISEGDKRFFEQHGGVPDDVAFLKMVVDELVRRGVTDSNRIYLAGLSLGGVMTLRMGCVAAETFAGFGLLIAAMPEVFGTDCRMANRVPVLMISATADQRLPYGGGRSAAGENIWSTDRLLRFFRDLNGCSEAPPLATLPGAHAQRIEMELSTKCSGAPVHLYRVVGGGHAVPHSMNPSQMLVDFFRNKARSEGVSIVRVPPPTARAVSHMMYRRFDAGKLVTGDVQRLATGAWLETNTRGSRWTFRVITENPSEVVLYDESRDVFVRMDLTTKKMSVRKGITQDWIPLADIVWTDK